MRVRDRYGDEMLRVFEAGADRRLSERGVPGLLKHTLSALVDALRNGLAERLGPAPAGGGRGRARTDWSDGMTDLARDFRHGLRSLRRSPAFTIAAVLTMALGIGANTAIFSVVRAVLLRPLPYSDPDRLVLVWGEMRQRDVHNFPFSPPDLQDLREMTTTLESAAGVLTFPQPLAGQGEPVQVMVGGVTPNAFSVLGVAPARGRDFVAADGAPVDPGIQPGDPGYPNQIAILDYDFWQTRWGGDPNVVGSIIDLGGAPTEVVGIMPRGFRMLLPETASLANDVDIWTALRINYATANRNNVFLRVFGRLRPGVTLPQAQADADRIAADLSDLYEVKSGAGFAIAIASMHGDLVAPIRPVILALMGAVAFVLLIACANVGNLLLVRSSARVRELAVRAAVGGSRWHLVRQVLAESLLLSVAGGLVGVGLATGGIRLLLTLQPGALPRADSIALDPWVLGFTGLAVLLCAVLFGLVPALRASRPAIVGVLREGGRGPDLSGNAFLRSGVIVAEVALSLILLIGAGLMVRTFVALQRIDPGYDPEGVLTFVVPLPFARYPATEQRAAFSEQLHDRLAGLAGVQSVTAAFPLPLDGQLFNGRWGLRDALADPDNFRQANFFMVLPGYFETLRTEVVAGRTFTWQEERDSAAVVVIDERLAATAFPDRPAIGERLLVRVSSPDPQWVEVIGVVRGQRHMSLAEPDRESMYFTDRFVGSFGLTWALRTTGDPARMAGVVRSEVAAIDPLLPVASIRPYTDLFEEATAETRFVLTLIGIFAAIALALAVIGLYGVLAYAVRQRTAEIGVRMAFGARSSTILRLVVGQGLALSAIGVALGGAGAVALTRVMSSLLVGVTPTDPATFASIMLLFLAAAALASFVPGWRASRVDPVRALREE